jgi:hypothetical protein
VLVSAHESLIQFCLFFQIQSCKGAPLFSFFHLEVDALVLILDSQVGGSFFAFFPLLLCFLLLMLLALFPLLGLGVGVPRHHVLERGWEGGPKPTKDDVSVVFLKSTN